MDVVALEKLQAMKRYNRKNHFLQRLFQFSLTAFVLGLCASKGLASLCSFMKLFFFGSLPNIGAFVFGPKCLFVLGNMIVIYLVGESKLVGSSSSDSPTSDAYDEYVKHSRGLIKLSTKERKEKSEVSLVEENVEVVTETIVEDEEKKGREEEKKGREDKNMKKGVVDLDREEEFGLPADELNKRVEDFIARVNEQRKLEAKMMVSVAEKRRK
ncbi:DUF4408 domain-containing protein [Cinnamomum micranthum f. kanehirae]|uniref:DUF4408 domain-containing protein n=1 Tax=Cinnamomum micranthum f. kanehirae TaxID=337451 RepID=A0A443P8B9_9MAGN|nr:DUF4408 domain-containing protein [Cinnamomum micranthum f. kanehirae]